MTKKNNKDKKSSVKSNKDKPKKTDNKKNDKNKDKPNKNIILVVMNKKKDNDNSNINDSKNDESTDEKKINKKNTKKEEIEHKEDENKKKSDSSDDDGYIDEDDDEYIDEDDDEYIDEDDDEYIDEDDDEYIDENDDEYEETLWNTSNNKFENDLEDGEIEEDDDEDNEDDEDDEDDEDNKDDEDKTNKRNSNKRKPDNSLDDLFSAIIGGSGMFNDRPPSKRSRFRLSDEELKSKRDKKKKEKVENFYDYFKESKELLPINKKIETLQDLIDLGETYDKKDKKRYVIHLKALHKCLGPLKELNNFIGMSKIKEMILDLIFLRLQNIDAKTENEMWHLVVQGSPGCGKTEVSRVIGKIYYGLGIVEKDTFVQVKRSDLIGKWCGHTAAQTQEIFDKNEGGVIFIDEAYSLGNAIKTDSFTKECIDTINLNLTEKKKTVVIIAGYKEQLDESFFSYNPGLARRFKMRLSLDDYNHEELRKIYLKKLKDNDWLVMNDDVDKEIPLDFFEKNREIFKFNGGDMENLWSLTKVVHCRRIFGKDNNLTKKITKEDVYNAFEKYKENEEVSNRGDDKAFKKYIQDTMYC